MKKIFAIFAIILMTGVISYATDTYTDNGTGTFTAGVLCTPTLTDPSPNDISLGNHFSPDGPVDPGTAPLVWYLNGPIASYTISCQVSDNPNGSLSGTFSVEDVGLMSWTEGALQSVGPETLPDNSWTFMNCSGTADNDQIAIEVDATSLTINSGVAPGNLVWTVTISIQANI